LFSKGYTCHFKSESFALTNVWAGSKLLSLKAPTAVLMDSNQEFMAFGYEAENKYSELVADGEHEEYYYFHRFVLSYNHLLMKMHNLSMLYQSL
jgi:hypothetical protein